MANASKTIVQSGIALRGPRKELVAVNVDSPREFPSSYLGFHSAAAGFPAALDSLTWSKVPPTSRKPITENGDTKVTEVF
jgi:hypothetical protein